MQVHTFIYKLKHCEKQPEFSNKYKTRLLTKLKSRLLKQSRFNPLSKWSRGFDPMSMAFNPFLAVLTLYERGQNGFNPFTGHLVDFNPI